jgi:hypothetical protein
VRGLKQEVDRMKRVSVIVSILVVAFACVSYAGNNPDAKVSDTCPGP